MLRKPGAHSLDDMADCAGIVEARNTDDQIGFADSIDLVQQLAVEQLIFFNWHKNSTKIPRKAEVIVMHSENRCKDICSHISLNRGHPMNIVFVSPEMVPFVKVGGLADVVSSLSKELHRRKENVSVILPYYSGIDRLKFPARDTGKKIRVWMDGAQREAAIWSYDFDGVQVHLLDNPEFYGRDAKFTASAVPTIPTTPSGSLFCPAPPSKRSKCSRFSRTFFTSTTGKRLCCRSTEKSLTGMMLSFGGAAVVLTIHNLAYQGTFDKEAVPRLGLPWDVFQIEGLEFHGKVNLLKGGLLYSELLTTVSPTYAKEIQTPELGAGLFGLLRSRASDLVGIINGIDPSLWDPASDELLFETYDTEDVTGKATNKQKLQEMLGLAPLEEAPLFGCVARLDPQKGFDLILEIAPQMLEEGAQLAILGSGWEEYVRSFRALEKKYPNQLSMNEGFQQELAPKIYAGSDFFLMPSRFEPCGLGQMIALRYGTIPVVRRTGGLADTIIDLDDDPVRGNGFSFQRYKAAELEKTIRRARAHFADPLEWRELVGRAMRADFTWTQSVDRYLEVYESAIQKAHGGPQ